MRPGPLFALFLVLTAARGFAQSAPPPPPSEPPLVEVPVGPTAKPAAKPAARGPEARSERVNRLPRIAVETLAGAGLAVAGGVLANEGAGPAYVFAAGPLGMAVGIWGAGFMMDGDGHPLAVLGGEALGFVAGYYLGTALSLRNGYSSNPYIVYVTMGIATLVGGVVGFELGSSDSRTAREAARQPLSFVPLLAPTRDGQGAVIGFAFQL
ncbi:MAG TPA: hypothetical protein VK420_21650 [Longimicrobium sp.]|nr:hypothetical protein [Longimicrobium sp.]